VITGINVLLPGPSASLPAPILDFIALYLLTGLLGGLILGIGRPFLAKRIGASLVGIAAAIPWYVGIRVLAFGFDKWSRWDIGFVFICAIVCGTIVSQVIWSKNYTTEK
jgi:hypothetical protein